MLYYNSLLKVFFLQSRLSMKGYLLTDAPSVTTASLFWKLTDQQESFIVIVLPDSHQVSGCLSPVTMFLELIDNTEQGFKSTNDVSFRVCQVLCHPQETAWT